MAKVLTRCLQVAKTFSEEVLTPKGQPVKVLGVNKVGCLQQLPQELEIPPLSAGSSTTFRLCDALFPASVSGMLCMGAVSPMLCCLGWQEISSAEMSKAAGHHKMRCTGQCKYALLPRLCVVMDSLLK